MELFTNETRSAVISEDRQYRYELRRTWDESKPKVLFIMLNPSTADANIDDPTIRRCIGFAKRWGFGGILVGNLFAYRATEPKALLSTDNPIGKDNIKHLQLMYNESEIIICAWGNSKIIDRLDRKISDYKPLSGIIGKLHYLELSNDGTPKHPLYLKSNLIPTEYKISFFDLINTEYSQSCDV
jgi:hypothetical protein